MRASSDGLARLTVRTPRRRLDLAIPHHVPLAELLPELLRRAGEVRAAGLRGPADGWMLRRGDGTSLLADAPLAAQGVRDGDVLYLVPRSLAWPEPISDDLVDEVAAGALRHGRVWDAAATRLFALVVAALVLLAGLAALGAGGSSPLGAVVAAAVAVVLVVTGALLSRAFGDGVAGATAGGLALGYSAAAGVLAFPGPVWTLDTDRLLAGACALVLAATVAAVAIGHGLRFFVAGAAAGLATAAASLLGVMFTPAGSASVAVVVLIAAIGVTPTLAVRLGRVPLPAVTADPDLLAAETPPDRASVLAAVARADDILAGSLLGIAVVAVGCVTVLSFGAGLAPPLLGCLASASLLLRARLFPSVAARLPLLCGGAAGLSLAGLAAVGAGGPALRVSATLLALMALLGLLAVAAAAPHRRRSPYLARLADVADTTALVALVPVACAAIDVYGWVRALAG